MYKRPGSVNKSRNQLRNSGNNLVYQNFSRNFSNPSYNSNQIFNSQNKFNNNNNYNSNLNFLYNNQNINPYKTSRNEFKVKGGNNLQKIQNINNFQSLQTENNSSNYNLNLINNMNNNANCVRNNMINIIPNFYKQNHFPMNNNQFTNKNLINPFYNIINNPQNQNSRYQNYNINQNQAQSNKKNNSNFNMNNSGNYRPYIINENKNIRDSFREPVKIGNNGDTNNENKRETLILLEKSKVLKNNKSPVNERETIIKLKQAGVIPKNEGNKNMYNINNNNGNYNRDISKQFQNIFQPQNFSGYNNVVGGNKSNNLKNLDRSTAEGLKIILNK